MDRSNFQHIDEPTREKIVKLVTANPQISLKELAEALSLANTSNVHYHIRRLEKLGRIKWQGSVRVRARGPQTERSASLRKQRGEVMMPKLSKAELDARIEMVVRKAQARETLRQDHDVIHDYRSRFRGYSLKAHKV